MKHATSRALFAYWDRVRGERVAAERGDLTPGDMRHVLADAFIIGRDESRAPVVRLAGTRLCALFGRDLKGAGLASLWRPDDPDPERWLGMLGRDAVGVVAGLVGMNLDGSELPLELLLLPLRHRGRTDLRALGALSPASIPSWAGLVPLSHLETRSVRIIEPRREREGLTLPDPVAIGSARRARLVVHEGGRA